MMEITDFKVVITVSVKINIYHFVFFISQKAILLPTVYQKMILSICFFECSTEFQETIGTDSRIASRELSLLLQIPLLTEEFATIMFTSLHSSISQTKNWVAFYHIRIKHSQR